MKCPQRAAATSSSPLFAVARRSMLPSTNVTSQHLKGCPRRYEGQRDILSNQTYNLDQLAFASDRIKDAQHTMTAMKAANTELKGMMKTVRIEDIDSMQDETMDVMDVSSEIQETLGRNYNVPDDIDEEGLICSWLFLDDSNTRRMN
ncbi:hypothetical protein CFC21_009640 [Triticum aestivum]|uniref:Charged multivesicular body protein 5 n=2 Tax=Triticum aestivum TaxID=4565 RepID=A0A9R1IU34_WHEAT|nr:vacuolar protein sorting-associated protein 60.2-like isoform X1 [Triticum aestivum]KAF6992619.1 hypothetical protein CFC21_009595 [Triticum aestivum]KAF6992659.1 hypothetical protein CFC21_009640 [Triticum aestivum]